MAVPPDDMTLGEIGRRLGDLRLEMNEKFAAMNHRLDTMEFVPRGEHNLQMKEHDDRLAALEEHRKWLSRTLVASFLYPVLVAVVVTLVVIR